MRLLDRYLLREFLVPLAYCLAGFQTFWIAFQLFNELPLFQERGLSAAGIAWYFVLKTPDLLPKVLPMALLLALLYALTRHARHNELVAMRAAGISLWRIGAGYLAVGALLSLVLLASNEWLAPVADEVAERLLLGRAPRAATPAAVPWTANINFRNESDDHWWRASGFHAQRGELLNPSVEYPGGGGTTNWLVADRAVWTNGAWLFLNVRLHVRRPSDPDIPEIYLTNRLAVAALTESPRQMQTEIKIGTMTAARAAKQLRFNLRDLADYSRFHPRLPADRRALVATQFHGRLAQSWTCLVVVFIALPFGAFTSRRNAFAGVAASVFLVVAHYFLTQIGLALGTGLVLPTTVTGPAPWLAELPPLLATWGPNMLFAALGIWATQKLR
jgi:lipopolysaccharide export system permease protein